MGVFVGDLNTGGIVAGVIVVLLLLALLGFGLFYAHKKGYLASKSLASFYTQHISSQLSYRANNMKSS